MSEQYRYDRVLLKLSGEALAGDVGYGIDPKVVDDLADQIADIVHDGVQLAVVVGGFLLRYLVVVAALPLTMVVPML